MILGMTIRSFAGEYRWPMKLAPELTSRFCDNRAGHFHAGMDIRTRGKTGYRVYAVDNGHIFRISARFDGYGKAIYLMLDDGRIAVYGHLLRFDEDLDERLRRIQMKNKKYKQDLFFAPGELPVTMGQMIGLSGASGAGAPHLHFELRSANNNPLNPLRFGFEVEDGKSPEFHRLAIRVYKDRFDPGAPSDIEIVDPLSADGGYLLEDTLYVDGFAALAVSGGDLIDGRGYLYGFYSLQLFLDDSLVFSSSADSISYETTGQQDYIRDIELGRLTNPGGKSDNDRHVFHRLYIPPGAGQYFWDDSAYTGIIPPSAEPGSARKFEIAARDESGNEARLRGVIVTPKLRKPDPEFLSYYRFGDTLEVDFLTFESVGSCRLQYRNTIGSVFQPTGASLTAKTWNLGGEAAYLNTVRAVSSYITGDYRISFSNEIGESSPWIYFVDGTKRRGFSLRGSPDFIRLEFYPDSIYSSLFVEIATATLTLDGEMNQAGVQAYYFDMRERELQGETRIRIKNGPEAVYDTSLIFYPAGKGGTVRAVSPDSSLTVLLDDESLYFPVYIFAPCGMTGTVMGIEAVVYDIEPVDILARNPIIFRFDLERTGLVADKTGVYGYAPSNDKWGFIGAGEGRFIEVEGLGLGRVALARDDAPPVISSLRPDKRVNSRRPQLSCVINDDLSGVKLDPGPQMWIDGLWVPAEYDLETKRLTYQVRNNLRTGGHTLAVEAEDGQGNMIRKTGRFSVGG